MNKILLFLQAHRFALLVWAGWLVAVWGLVLGAQLFLGQPVSLAAWAGDWDGGWYYSIVQHGYATEPPTGQVNLAFFPLYPLLVWVFASVTQLPAVWVGMALSSLCFAAALVLLQNLMAQKFDAPIVKWTLLLLAFNPFSFYFGMMYTEALFLLLAVATFWFLARQRWVLAAAAAGLASATRSVGVALGVVVVVALFIHLLTRSERRGVAPDGDPKKIFGSVPAKTFLGKSGDRTPSFVGVPIGRHPVMITAISFSGIILFSLYLWQRTGDPLAYMHAQQFWPGRGGLGNVANEIAQLFTSHVVNREYLLRLMWYAAAIVAFIGVVLVIRLRLWLMALYSAIALSLPILFGTATSMNRYAQVVFPVFMAFGAVLAPQRRGVKIGAMALCAVGLGAFILLLVDVRHPFVG